MYSFLACISSSFLSLAVCTPAVYAIDELGGLSIDENAIMILNAAVLQFT